MFFEYDKKQTPLQDYNLTCNRRLKVSPADWNELVSSYTKKEIIDHLTLLIEGLEFPYRDYTDGELKNDWNALKAERISASTSSWMTDRVVGIDDFTYQGTSLIFNCSNRGLKVSDQHTQQERMLCGHERYKSPYQQWTREPFKDKTRYLLNPLFSVMGEICKQRGIGDHELYNCIRMYSYMASQFKPSCAKAIYDFFDAKSVLDFSAGWGDRLVGFHASNAESYIGIDPNTKLHEPYEKISRYCNTNKKTRFICSPAEETDLSDVKVDFIFTSPPYFDTERYSQEDTQSWKRYNDVESWLNAFLLKTLSKCYEVLEEGGRIAVNISDVFSTKGNKILCQPMLNHMENIGAIYEGVIGYPLSKLPSIRTKQEKITLCEPIFIWSKGKAKEPKWTQDNFFGV